MGEGYFPFMVFPYVCVCVRVRAHMCVYLWNKVWDLCSFHLVFMLKVQALSWASRWQLEDCWNVHKKMNAKLTEQVKGFFQSLG